MGQFIKFLFQTFMTVSLILSLIRFAGPPVGICKIRAKRPEQVTSCFKGVITFKGDGITSIYRIYSQKD